MTDYGLRITHYPEIAWLTVERGLYALAFLVAALMRFFSLADQPLSTLEAVNAWAAWLDVSSSSAPTQLSPTSPLLYGLQNLAFWLAGGADALARGFPALFGMMLMLLIWSLRPWLGRTAALFLVFYLAMDPWLVAYSRLADGASLSIFLAMLALVGLLNLRESDKQEGAPTFDEQIAGSAQHITRNTHHASSSKHFWMVVTGVGVGLLLVSGPMAWNLLPVLIVWVALFANDALLASLTNRLLVLWAGVAAILGATAWLARPQGLSLVGTSLGIWLDQFTSSSGYPLSWVFIRLIDDQPFLLVFGLAGLILLWFGDGRRIPGSAPLSHQLRAPWRLFLTLWLVWGVLLVVAPGRNPFILAMLGLPLLFAGSYAVDSLLHSRIQDHERPESMALLAVLGVLAVSAAVWLATLIANRNFDSLSALAFLSIAGLTAILIMLFTVYVGPRLALWVMGVFLAGLLCLATVSSSWQLNHRGEPGLPEGFFAESTYPDINRLVANVETISAQRSGDAHELPVQVELGFVATPDSQGDATGPNGLSQPDPLLGWYLRNMRDLTWVTAPHVDPLQAPAPLVITKTSEEPPLDLETGQQAQVANELPSGYRGSRYALRSYWLPSSLGATELVAPIEDAQQSAWQAFVQRIGVRWTSRIQPLLRWMAYRKVQAVKPLESAVLWAGSVDDKMTR